MNAEPEPKPKIEVMERRGFVWDRRVIALIVLGILGALLFAAKNKESFPEASIDLKLTKNQITSRAVDWAKKLGYHKDKLISSTVFSYDDSAKTYLELELGGAKANELMKSEVPVWYWRSRLVKEFDPEQFASYISPDGKLTAFQIDLENDKKLPSVTQDQARAMAEDFVNKQTDLKLADYTLIEKSSQEKVHRTDHMFTWEDKKHPYKDGNMRITIAVSGDQLTSFSTYLYVPELWIRKYQNMRSYNDVLSRIAFVFNSLFYLASVCILIWALAKRNLRWRFAVVAGGVVAIGCVLAVLNSLPSWIDSYAPQQAFRSHMVKYVFYMLQAGLAGGLMGVMLVSAGEFMYRQAYPKKVSFENYFNWSSIGAPQISSGFVVGLSMFGIALGWVVAYYLVGAKIGFWCPLDVNNYQVLSAYSPAYSAVCIGVEAAFSEEILYRVIGMGLARRVVKNFWVANLFQAAAWGFAHSAYAQQPAYARGVELTLSGLLFGWICNTFGLLPCILAHYLLDAFLSCEALFSSAQPSLVASAMVPLIPFPLLAAFAVAKARTPSFEQPLLNEAIVPPPVVHHEPEPQSHRFSYEPLPKRFRIAALVIAVVSLAGMTAIGKQMQVGSSFQINITRDQAIARAWDVLMAHNVPIYVPGHKHHAWLVVADATTALNSDEMQYLFEKLKMQKTLEMVDRTQPGFYWRVRFFKPMQATEYWVYIDSKGNEIDFTASLPDYASGASLKEGDARALAENYVNRTHREFTPYTYESPGRNEKKKRVDYNFTYNVPSQKVGDAQSKLTISVVGDQVSSLDQHWAIPDQWKWERDKRTWKDDAVQNTTMALGLVFLIMALIWVIGLFRVGYFPFRAAILFGIAMVVLNIPGTVNGYADIFMKYGTTLEIGTFYFNRLANFLQGVMGQFAEYGLTMLLTLPCARLLAPAITPMTMLRTVFWPEREDADECETHKNVWIDAVLVAYATLALGGLLEQVTTAVQLAISPAVQQVDSELYQISSLLNTFVPGLDIVPDSLIAGVSTLVFTPIAVGFYAKYLRTFPRFLFAVMTVAAVFCAAQRYWQDFAVNYVSAIVMSVFCWLLVAKLARTNILTYVLLGACSILAERCAAILLHAPRLMLSAASSSIIMLLLPIAYVLYLLVSGKSKVSTAAS